MTGSDPTPQSRDSGRGGFLAFWATIPGVLTGSAALLTAIIALMTLLKGSGVDQEAPEVGTTATAPEISVAESPTSPQNSSSAAIIAQGEITMRSPDSADLETGLVGTSPPGYDLYLHCSGVDCILNAMSSLMTVADGAGDRSSCITALQARRDQALYLRELSSGQVLCVQTADGHIGALEIRELPGVGSLRFVFSYRLWS